jgi:enoyl-CoA hydratase/carnithine racemase
MDRKPGSRRLSIAGTKHILNVLHEGTPTADEREKILALRRRAIGSADALEAVQAFRDKRPPQFVGR